MENNKKLFKEMNWEKTGVYIAIATGFFMMISYLFSMKDEISDLKERMAFVEVKIEKR